MNKSIKYGPDRPTGSVSKIAKTTKFRGTNLVPLRELRNEASGLGFFMFFIGAKNKKSNFFFEMISNHSKMVPNTPKLYLNVILVCFAVIGG